MLYPLVDILICSWLLEGPDGRESQTYRLRGGCELPHSLLAGRWTRNCSTSCSLDSRCLKDLQCRCHWAMIVVVVVLVVMLFASRLNVFYRSAVSFPLLPLNRITSAFAKRLTSAVYSLLSRI